MAQPVVVTAWIDFLCPWSWVVMTRLERVAAPYGDRVELGWHAHMRYPEKQVRDLAEWRKSTIEWMEPAAAEPELAFSLWATGNAPPTHSAPALAAALVAIDEDPDRAPAYWKALFRAHFTENRTISDGGTLIAIAREVGIDEDGFAMRLRGRYAKYVATVIEDHNEGGRRGVADTPAVIVADEFLIRGTATDEQYRDVIEQVLASRSGTEASDDSSTAADPVAPATIEATPDAVDEAKAPEPASAPTEEAKAPESATADPAPVKAPAKKAASKKAAPKKSAGKKAPAKKAGGKKAVPAEPVPPASSGPPTDA